MGFGNKGGAADQSGVEAALVSANAADKAYALGEQQFLWSQQVWNQEQPLINQVEQAQMDAAKAAASAQEQVQAFAGQQQQMYEQYYAPLEKNYIAQAENWASPQNMALVTGEARANVAQGVNQGLNTAKEQLMGFGVNPDAGKYAGEVLGANVLGGAAEAGAGTSAAQNLRLQQLALEQGAINTGRGAVNSTGQLTQAATGAGSSGSQAASGAGATAQSNLATGASSAAQSTNFFNAGTSAENAYTSAVNGYNTSQLGYAQLGAQELGGLGSLAGGVLGSLTTPGSGAGGVGSILSMFEGGGDVKRQSSPVPLPPPRPLVLPPVTPIDTPPKENFPSTGPMFGQKSMNAASGGPASDDYIPPLPPSNITGPEWERQFKAHNDAIDKILHHVPPSAPQQDTPPTFNWPSNGVRTDPSMNAARGGDIPPRLTLGSTPGGPVPIHASPSHGQVTDDVPAQLTAGEFVIPKDVAAWKGHEHFVKAIDKARQEQEEFRGRDDIGGEPAQGIPQRPTFVSRPHPASAIAQQGIPQRRVA